MEPRRGRTRRSALAAAGVAALAALISATAAAAPTRGLHAHAQHNALTQAAPLQARLESRLAAVAMRSRAAGAARVLAAARSTGLDVRARKVRVVVEAQRGKARAVTVAVRRLGGRVETRHLHLVQALVPASSLAPLASTRGVRFVRPPYEPKRAAVPGEGVGASNAAAWHAPGLTGAGVKVAVIDVSFRGYHRRQAEGDLPATATTRNFCADGFEGHRDLPNDDAVHGTASAEIVHEMAPGAQLYLICVGSDVELAQAFAYARNQGVRVISFSLGWDGLYPGDGSGAPWTPNGLVAAARAAGILWVAAAGNEARHHWGGAFTDPDRNGWHNFSPDAEYNMLLIAPGEEVCANMRWHAWPTTSEDYNLFLEDPYVPTPLAESKGLQTGTQPPTEALCYTNNAPYARAAGLTIQRVSGTQAPHIDLFARSPLEFAVPAGSVSEPASSPSALAVGAICWRDNSLEPYSSQGPTVDGRVKPDIAGPAVISSGSYGPTSACGDASTTGYNGTSAATPHVAGAAALVLQANPGFAPGQLQEHLERSAGDLGSPGKDNAFGAGKLFLAGAIPALPASPPTHAASLADAAGDSGGGPDVTSVQVATGTPALAFRIAVPNRAALAEGETIQVFIDADQNPQTGNGGSELNLAAFPDGSVTAARWNGSDWTTIHFLGDSGLAAGVLTFVANWNLGLGSAFTFDVASYVNGAATDRAPGGSRWSFPTATLSVAKSGIGGGTVTSAPAGIDCGAACAAAFASGTSVTLTPVPAADSRFEGWSGACTGTGACTVTVDMARAVEARFEFIPAPPARPTPPRLTCLVPNVKRKTLAAAKSALRRAGCASGYVRRSHSRAVKAGRVISQAPAAGRRVARGARVNLVVSRGRKR